MLAEQVSLRDYPPKGSPFSHLRDQESSLLQAMDHIEAVNLLHVDGCFQFETCRLGRLQALNTELCGQSLL